MGARGGLGKARSAGPRCQHRPLSRQSCDARRRARGVEASDLLEWPAADVPCTKTDAQAAKWTYEPLGTMPKLSSAFCGPQTAVLWLWWACAVKWLKFISCANNHFAFAPL